MENKWYMAAIPVTDFWNKARFESGRTSQVLYGRFLRAVKSQSGYAFCHGEDNYTGWVRESHLIELPKDLSDLKRAVVRKISAPVLKNPADSNPVLRLSYGSAVFYDRIEGELAHSVYPAGWMRKSDLAFKPAFAKTFNPILRDLKLFLGTPYLWGGKSGFGIDCSGLVQLVYNSHGFYLPRDSIDQAEYGRRIARKNIKPGDLVFSPGHVSVNIGNEKILHANSRCGMVSIESIDKKSALYREDIARNIVVIRRIL